MPIYQYHCTHCGQQIEALQKMNDPLLTDCHACEHSTLQRSVTSPRFRLKGQGYYETDEKPKDKQRYIAGKSSEAEIACTPAACEAPACPIDNT